MSRSAEIQVQLTQFEKGQGARGLLAPLPPALNHQRLQRIDVIGARQQTWLQADNGQEALLVTPEENERPCLVYTIDLCRLQADSSSPREPDRDCLPPYLEAEICSLLRGAVSDTERERRLIDFATERLSYGPRATRPIASQLACGLGSGNCIDINRFLVAALASCGIPTSYYAGYYFPPGVPPSLAEGMHCWISTNVDGSQHFWDVSYSLKYDSRSVPEGIDHLGGLHIAMSVGMDMAFDIDGVAHIAPYLAQPLWVFPNGELRTADVVCHAVSSTHARAARRSA